MKLVRRTGRLCLATPPRRSGSRIAARPQSVFAQSPVNANLRTHIVPYSCADPLHSSAPELPADNTPPARDMQGDAPRSAREHKNARAPRATFPRYSGLGCRTGIRTPIPRSRVACPTVGRSGKQQVGQTYRCSEPGGNSTRSGLRNWPLEGSAAGGQQRLGLGDDARDHSRRGFDGIDQPRILADQQRAVFHVAFGTSLT